MMQLMFTEVALLKLEPVQAPEGRNSLGVTKRPAAEHGEDIRERRES